MTLPFGYKIGRIFLQSRVDIISVGQDIALKLNG